MALIGNSSGGHLKLSRINLPLPIKSDGDLPKRNSNWESSMAPSAVPIEHDLSALKELQTSTQDMRRVCAAVSNYKSS